MNAPKILEQWIEVENGYITNQPLIWKKGGPYKRREKIPDPARLPTEASLFCFDCQRKGKLIIRRRFLKTIEVSNPAELDQRVADYVADKILIASPDEPLRYQQSNREPVEIKIEEEQA